MNHLTNMLFYLFCAVLMLYNCNAQDNQLMIIPSSGYVQIGGDFNLICNANTMPLIIGRIAVVKDSVEKVSIIKNPQDVANVPKFILSNISLPVEDVKQYSWTLSRNAATTEDSGSYLCRVFNSAFQYFDSNQVTVTIGSAPSEVNMVFLDGTQILNPDSLTDKSNFKVVCEGSGGSSNITLYKNGAVVKFANANTGANTVMVESQFYQMPQDLSLVHNMEFNCIIRNPWGSQEKINIVQIKYAPQNSMITLNNSTAVIQTLKPGTKLVCQATGYPTPSVIFDTSYNKTLFQSGGSGNELIIQDLDHTVTGTILCLAENTLGKASKTFTILIDTSLVNRVTNEPSENAGVKSSGVMIAGIVIAIIALIVIVGVVFFCFRRRLNNDKNSNVKYESAHTGGDVDKVNNEWLKANSTGSSKIRDVDIDDGVGQVPEKPARPSLQRKENQVDTALLPDQQEQLDDTINYDSSSFNDKPGNRQPLIDLPVDNGNAKLDQSRPRKGPPPGAFQLPAPVPVNRQSDDYGSSV